MELELKLKKQYLYIALVNVEEETYFLKRVRSKNKAIKIIEHIIDTVGEYVVRGGTVQNERKFKTFVEAGEEIFENPEVVSYEQIKSLKKFLKQYPAKS